MSQLPQRPGMNPTYGSPRFPGKRSSSGPATYNDIAATTSDGVGTGRSGVVMPGGTRSFTPGAAGITSDVVSASFRVPSISEAKTVSISARTNGYTPYARKARQFKDTDLDVDLFQAGMVINTFKDKNTTAIASRAMYEHYRQPGISGQIDFLHRRPIGNRSIMAHPISTNFLLASTEPAVSEDNQFKAWTVDDVIQKWNFCDGIVLNQEGGASSDGINHDKGKDGLINMIIHGRIEGVLNIWGDNLETNSELFFILKRAPKTAPFVLDPSMDSIGYYSTYSYGGGVKRPVIPSDGVITKSRALGMPSGLAKHKYVPENPWQLCPFQPTPVKPRPCEADTWGMDDHGNWVEGAVIRLGRVWFPGRHPMTYQNIKHLEPLTNVSDYLRCGVITVIKDNHGFQIRN